MKAVLAIEQGVIPPTIGITTLNPDSKLWTRSLGTSD